MVLEQSNNDKVAGQLETTEAKQARAQAIIDKYAPLIENKDYHAILGVSPGATADEIKTAFRKAANLIHPDLWKFRPELPEELHNKITEIFKGVNEANEKLNEANEKPSEPSIEHDVPLNTITISKLIEGDHIHIQTGGQYFILKVYHVAESGKRAVQLIKAPRGYTLNSTSWLVGSEILLSDGNIPMNDGKNGEVTIRGIQKLLVSNSGESRREFNSWKA